MREAKTHWRGRYPAGGRIKHNGKTITLHRTLCGLMWGSFANKKRAVTCLRCQRMLAGYSKPAEQAKGEVK